MAFALIVTIVICSSLSFGNALMCYECNEFTSSDTQLNTLLAQALAQGGQATCQSPLTSECTEPEGCQSSEITFYYTSTTNGDFSVTQTSRGCGAPVTTCMDPDSIPGAVDAIRTGLESILTGMSYQFTYSRHEGSICSCNTGDLCNQGAQTDEGTTGGSTAAPAGTTEGMGDTGTTGDGTTQRNGLNTTAVMETTTDRASSLIANLGLILVALTTLLACKMV